MTVKEHIDQAIVLIRQTAPSGMVSRERAVAITNLEQAQMWYTRGRAIEEDVFNPKDLDAI